MYTPKMSARMIVTFLSVLTFNTYRATTTAAQELRKPDLVIQNRLGRTTAITFSPDGKIFATNGAIKLWEAQTGRLLRELKDGSSGAISIAFDSGGEQITAIGREVTADYNDSYYVVRQWDVRTGSLLRKFNLKADFDLPEELTLSLDGRVIAALGQDSRTKLWVLNLWDAKSGRVLPSPVGPTKHDWSVVALDENTLVSTEWVTTIKLWDKQSRKLLRTIKGPLNPYASPIVPGVGRLLWPRWSRTPTIKTFDGQDEAPLFILDEQTGQQVYDKLATMTWETTVNVRDLRGGGPQRTLKLPNVKLLTLSPDGRAIASWGWDNTVRLWSASSGSLLRSLEGRSEVARSASFSADGKTVAAGGDDQIITLWDVQSGRLIRQLKGHHGSVSSIVFSSDGRTVASLGELGSSQNDPTRQLRAELVTWDVESGRMLRGIEDHSDAATSIAFSHDASMIAIGSEDKTVKLWDSRSGIMQRNLKGHAAAVRSITFSPDGRMVVSGASDQAVKLWNTRSGELLRTLDEGTTKPTYMNPVAFSPDGRTVAAGGNGQTIRLWDVRDGRPLGHLNGYSSELYSIAFSPDGQAVATVNSSGTVKVWGVADGKYLMRIRGDAKEASAAAFDRNNQTLALGESDGGIYLFNLTNMKNWRLNEPQGGPGRIYSIAFGPDNGTVITGGPGGTVSLWDASNGKLLRSYKRHEGVVSALSLGPDNRTVASGSSDGTAVLWDVQSGEVLRSLGRNPSGFRTITFSRDGRKVAAGGEDGITRLWDVQSGRLVRTFEGHSAEVRSIVFSSDDSFMISGGADKTVKLWDVESGRLLRAFAEEGVEIRSVALSPDGRTVALGGADEAVRLWDTRSGALKGEIYDQSPHLTAIAYSPDGKRLAAASEETAVVLWDAESGNLLGNLRGHGSPVFAIAFSPNGQTVASRDRHGDVRLWDAASGRLLRIFNVGALYNVPQFLAFSPDGRAVVTDYADGSSVGVKLWDAGSGRLLRNVQGPPNLAFSAVFSPFGSIIASGGADGTVPVWSLETGELLTTLLSTRDGGWLAVAPDGLFDGTAAGWNQIVWRFSQDTFDVASPESFFNEFYYPGLLTEILQGKRPRAPLDIARKDRRQPRLKLSLATGALGQGGGNTLRSVQLKIEVTGAPPNEDYRSEGGARDIRLFRNGSLVKAWPGDVLKGRGTISLETTVTLVAGENRLTAYAFNDDNIRSADATISLNRADGPERMGTEYILSIGINKYANPEFNLKFAVDDAQDLGQGLRSRQQNLGQFARVVVVPLFNEEATKDNILLALKRLAGTSTTLPAGAPPSLAGLQRAEPEDVIMIYFAGHGVADAPRYYLVPYDLGYRGRRTREGVKANLPTILAHSISDRDLQAAVEGMDVGQLVLIIDACNSGQLLESEEKRQGPMNSKGLAQLAYDKGMYILTASQSYQQAWGSGRLGHGYLTYALVEEGLKTSNADYDPRDGQVELREWLNYTVGRVPQIQEQDRAERRELVHDSAASEGGDAQRPRVFYRRELEPRPLIVAKP